MSEPFIAQIMYFGGNFAPRGWAFCSGQILSIAQNTALFSILGTTYGGNGQTTFALPDLRGRIALHPGQAPGQSNYVLGQTGGTENTSLTVQNLPAHNHGATFTSTSTLNAVNVKGTSQAPVAGYQLARPIDGDGVPDATPFIYAPTGTGAQVALGGLNVAGTVATTPTGSNTPVSILQPYQCVSAIIALQGIFPSRN